MLDIFQKIRDLKGKSERTPIFLCGSEKKTTTDARYSHNNRIHAYDFQFVSNVLTNELNIPRLGTSGCDLIIHSSGGSLMHAIAISKILHDKYGDVHVIVPSRAKSSAALMAFSASKLFIGDDGIVSDIFNMENIDATKFPAVIKHSSDIMKKGQVIAPTHVIPFLLMNAGLSQTKGHINLSMSELGSIAGELDININRLPLQALNTRDEANHLPARTVMEDILEIDNLIHAYMKANNVSKVNIFSDIDNNIY